MDPDYEAQVECHVCGTPGDWSCFTHRARHVHVCPECYRVMLIGEAIGTKASTCR